MDEDPNGIMADTLLTGTTLVEKESRSIGDAPVGTILAWAKSLAGVPNLAEGWVECDGSVLVDAQSSLNGVTLPDLNGGEFLEGQTTSGATGGSATMAHDHLTAITGDGSNFGVDDTYASSGDHTVQNSIPGTGTITNAFNFKTAAASNTENRPPFYTVVWIMRVR